MKRYLPLTLCCALAGVCLLSGCVSALVMEPAAQTTRNVEVVRRDPDPDQGALFGALAGDSIMALVLLEPTAEELALAGEVEEVFPPQELGERMLIVPRLPDSVVVIQQLNYDEQGALTGAEEIWRSREGAAGVLLQQDVPEGYATLRVVIQSGNQVGRYDVNYYGKGDGRRDFYVWLERAP